MLVAIPSDDPWNSLNVRNPRTIRSRMISKDQRSPNISREMLTGQPDRRFDLGFPGTLDRFSKYRLRNASDRGAGRYANGRSTATRRVQVLRQLPEQQMVRKCDRRRGVSPL